VLIITVIFSAKCSENLNSIANVLSLRVCLLQVYACSLLLIVLFKLPDNFDQYQEA